MTIVTNQKFTSEAVSIGHPDKIADQISDAVLDFCLSHDKNSRVAVETLVKDNHVILAGEVKTNAPLSDTHLRGIVEKVIHSIGYTDTTEIFNSTDFEFQNLIGLQSSDISQGVDQKDSDVIGAGDQGIMYGYACNETPTKMPLAYTLAVKLMERQQELLHDEINVLRPDAKAQVTLEYNHEGEVIRADTVLLSTQTTHDADTDFVRQYVRDEIIRPVVGDLIDEDTIILVNPTGRFVVGGPVGDCFTPNTLVKVGSDEFKPIGEIQVGDSVLSHNIHNGSEEADVVIGVRHIENTPKRALELTFENGEVVQCTEDHLFLTQFGWVAAKDLNETHDIKTTA